MNKFYLGDGAFATFDGIGVELTAENGIEASDHIYLEPEALRELVREWCLREPKLCGYLRDVLPIPEGSLPDGWTP